MTAPDLTPARLEELLAAASDGPWLVSAVNPTMVSNVSGWDVAEVQGDWGSCDHVMSADAALIALSPSLAARVIELEAEVERLREAASAYRNSVKNLLLFAPHGDAIAAGATLRSYAEVVGDEPTARAALETPNAD